jgi:hypothetical protein
MAIARGSAVIAMFAALALGSAAPASAVDDLNGHYTATETYPDGHSVASDWYFSYCEDGPGKGCSRVATQPGGEEFGRALLMEGQWKMLGSRGCEDGTGAPDAMNVLYQWDPNTLGGIVRLTNLGPVCGHPADFAETHNLQLTQAS